MNRIEPCSSGCPSNFTSPLIAPRLASPLPQPIPTRRTPRQRKPMKQAEVATLHGAAVLSVIGANDRAVGDPAEPSPRAGRIRSTGGGMAVDGVADEMHAAVAEHHVHAAGMAAARAGVVGVAVAASPCKAGSCSGRSACRRWDTRKHSRLSGAVELGPSVTNKVWQPARFV